jgi:hypothetical protein
VVRLVNKSLISGRIKASRAQAAHSLLTQHTALRPGPLAKPGKFRGRKVDIHFYNAASANILRLLADVGGINIIAPAESAKKFTLMVRNMPWDLLLELVSSQLGLVAHAAEKHTRFLAPADYALDKKLVKKGKGWLEVHAKDTSASLLASTIAAVSGIDYGLPCDARAVTLNLRRSKAGTAMAALELLSGKKLSKGPIRCPKPPALLTRPLEKEDRLLGTFYTGNRRRILIQNSVGDVFYSEDAKSLRIQPTFVAQGAVTLAVEEDETLLPELVGARLAATLVEGDRSAAVVQHRDGSFGTYYKSGVPYDLEIVPGKATFSGKGVKTTTLLLLPASP